MLRPRPVIILLSLALLAASGLACDDGGTKNTNNVNNVTAEICDDTLDNDGDGDIDCADTDCAAAANCVLNNVNNLNNLNNVNNLNNFTQPADTVAINFSIDDSANQTYVAGELQWKGSFAFDDTTRLLTFDGSWMGPYPTLHDDGPWTAGGHEPEGSVAGDHVWGVTVFFAVPAEETTFEYGAQDVQGNWLWTGETNGIFTIPALATSPVTAEGMTIEAFGTVDLMITLDSLNLNAMFSFNPFVDTVALKGNFIGWSLLPCVDDGTDGDASAEDDLYTFVLSTQVGPGTASPHAGLLHSGDAPEFLIVISGAEYKDNGAALTDGVQAFSRPQGGDWTELTVGLHANGNTLVTIP
ncbi:hypothetical protein KKC22_19065 [Myxococcota bacterium]|nr:hypothetical protein [Myxococcota bacterium]